MVIYTGKTAKMVCESILESRKGNDYTECLEGYECYSRGYWKEGNISIAYDNSLATCWVEEFKNKKDAIAYVKGVG